ncbi:hypothetical protein Ocin01_11783 [Orchesella cincta]|uniref:Uncharacterized protein n=1 Tax=Orchesella cincta TaxID=48709 RepID=A0A1D2MQ63_ORCCI|nr:hypothetical protein Ocin01_11783 [Orchesella cincta]
MSECESISSQCASKNCDEMETIIVEDLVKPVIFILNYAQPFADTIMYSSEARSFLAVKGSIWRKSFCILLELLILLRLGVKTAPIVSNYSNGNDNGMTALAKGAYFIFLSFYAVVKWTARASLIFVILYIVFTIIIYGVDSLKFTNYSDPNRNGSSKPSRFKLDFTEIHSPHDSTVSKIVFAVEIRTFNEIGKLIETFNQHYGLMNVLGLAVVVTYISTSVEHVFSGFQNIFKPGAGLHLFLSYIPMMIPALLLAEVSRVAGSFAGIIKNQFGKFTKECGDPAEALCGIAIVHYDLATSNIGIKGLGFYTVSYQFITTVLSLIVTYSIVIVQMFPHDESQENDLTN